jgi:hypothetical protein
LAGNLWHLDLSGDAWEAMCNTLLSLKYGPEYQTISDNGGDYGLDGLNLTKATAYQAYGLEMDNKNPLKGCKDKIHTDLKKLQKNAQDIIEILGDVKLKHWGLILNRKIPHSDLHKYLKTKEIELKSWNLPFIDPSFQAVILEPTYLEGEYLEFIKKKDGRIELDIPIVAAPDLSEIKENQKFLDVYNKFTAFVDQSEAEQLAYYEIQNYIENTIVLDEMRKREPEFFTEIEEIRSDLERDAEHGSLMEGSFASYTSTKDALNHRIDHKIGNRLGTITLGRVKKYIIADWLVRGPLRFKEKKAVKYD